MMKNQSGKLTISLLGVVALCLTVAWSAQQSAAPATVPVTITVSVEAKHGKDIPAVYREDVRVFHDRDRLRAFP
jgi:phosphate-selective porin